MADTGERKRKAKQQRKLLEDRNSKEAWGYVKNRCQLDEEEVWMAKKLGFAPTSVLRLIPDRKESWKDDPPLRIRRLYSKKYGSVMPVKVKHKHIDHPVKKETPETAEG